MRRDRLINFPPVGELPIEITPAEVSALLKKGEALRMIDVREPAEHAICHIDGAALIPMQTVPRHIAELEAETSRLVVFCHHGVRSLSVVDWLRGQGVTNCQSMSGGIDRWSREIDPAVPRY